jgi:hypothetical protein
MTSLLARLFLRTVVGLFLAYIGAKGILLANTMHGFNYVVMLVSGTTTHIMGWWFWQSPEMFTWEYWERQNG